RLAAGDPAGAVEARGGGARHLQPRAAAGARRDRDGRRDDPVPRRSARCRPRRRRRGDRERARGGTEGAPPQASPPGRAAEAEGLSDADARNRRSAPLFAASRSSVSALSPRPRGSPHRFFLARKGYALSPLVAYGDHLSSPQTPLLSIVSPCVVET